MADIGYVERRVERLKVEKEVLLENIERKKKEIEEKETEYKRYLGAKVVLIEASKRMQRAFKGKVERLVTTVLQYVYDRSIEFRFVFDREEDEDKDKGKKVVCRPMFYEGEEEFSPKDMGGGTRDLTGTFFKPIFGSMIGRDDRQTYFFDEPLKNNLGPELLKRAFDIFKRFLKGEIVEDIKFQCIIVTNHLELIELADVHYHLSSNGVETKVKLMKSNFEEQLKVRRK